MKTKVFQMISLLMLTIILFGAVPQTVGASSQAQTAAQEQVAAQAPPPVDSQELEAFVDDLLAVQMAENHIPGAVGAVVEDGRLLIAKGYSYANLDDQIV